MTSLSGGISHELNLLEILGGIKRRFYLIIAFTLLFTIFGLLIISVSPRKFEAQTLLTLETSDHFRPDNNNASPNLLPPAESVLLSHVEMLQSQDMAQNIVDDLKLDQDQRFWHKSARPQDNGEARQKALLAVANNVNIKPIGRSLVIEISYKHPDAEMAAMIVNRYAEIFQEQQIKEKIAQSKYTGIWLERRLEILNKKLRESARAVEEYRAKEDLIDGAKAEITSQQISDISSQLMQAQAEEAGIMARKSQIGHVLKNKKPLDDVQEVKESHLVNLFKRDETVLTTQLAQLQSKYGPNHPKILSVKAEIGELHSKKQAEISRVTTSVDNEVLTIQAKINLLQKNLHAVEQKRFRENQAAIGLRELQSEADANRELYNNFLNRYKETRMLADSHQPDTKIISRAKTPIEPTGPNPILIIMVVSFSGFIFGVLIALLMEQLEVTIRNPEQIKQLTGLETLAVIPKLKLQRKTRLENHVLDQPYSPVTEALRNVCLRLLGRLEKTPSVITMTSCLPEEGKTATIIGMAKLMAKSGLRVILVDGNFRYPGLQSYFPGQAQYSVTDFIFKRTSLENIIVKDESLPTFSILTGRNSSPDDIATLSQSLLQETIERLKWNTDIILIDAPSFQIAEAQLFNRIADHCLVTVHWDKTPMRLVSSVFGQMSYDKNKIMGYIITEENMT